MKIKTTGSRVYLPGMRIRKNNRIGWYYMSERNRNDKKFRKEMRFFFRSKHGQELTNLTRQNGLLKLLAVVALVVAFVEAAVITIIILRSL